MREPTVVVSRFTAAERAKLSTRLQASYYVSVVVPWYKTTTYFIAERFSPQLASGRISDGGLQVRWWKRSISACVRPIITKNNKAMRGALPCGGYRAFETNGGLLV
jgi:hypothetical protein